MENARFDQYRVKRDGIVADGQEKPIALFPFGIFGPVAKGMKIGYRQHIRDAERLRNVTLPLNGPHPECIPSNAVGSL